MDPTSHPNPSLEMPPAPSAGMELIPRNPEVAAVPELAPPLRPTLGVIDATGGVQMQAPPMVLTSAPVATPVAGVVASATPSVADDIDLIEKEWVDKAKAIVLQTRNDPHNQNKEMNRFKADYMKKRYNKDIKLSEV